MATQAMAMFAMLVYVSGGLGTSEAVYRQTARMNVFDRDRWLRVPANRKQHDELLIIFRPIERNHRGS